MGGLHEVQKKVKVAGQRCVESPGKAKAITALVIAVLATSLVLVTLGGEGRAAGKLGNVGAVALGVGIGLLGITALYGLMAYKQNNRKMAALKTLLLLGVLATGVTLFVLGVNGDASGKLTPAASSALGSVFTLVGMGLIYDIAYRRTLKHVQVPK